MSLIRQIWLLLLCTLLLALLGSVGVNVLSARGYLQTQLRLKNSDSAAVLALALSQQHGERALMDLLLTAQFDTGAYSEIRFDPSDGSAPFVRTATQGTTVAPQWFVRAIAIEPVPGLAQVSDGWRALGSVQVTSSLAFAYDELWRASLRAAAALGVVALAAGLLVMLAVARIRRPLDAAVGQARALVEGRFVTVPEPAVKELQALTQAMNSMVVRLKQTFELQAAQVEQLRQRAQCDGLTGLSNRNQFLSQLEATLQREDGAEHCGLVLLRLRDLDGVNRTLGHAATDRVIESIAEALRPYAERAHGCFLGRLNGSDFALCLPVGGLARETAQALAAALGALLPGLGQGISAAFGAVELARETSLAQALAAADRALARAEARGAYEVELGDERPGDHLGAGEHAWRQGIADALAQGRVRLVDFPLIDSAAALVHLECPLRLQLQAGGAFEVAARWLPLAIRARMTAEVDARAVALALEAIARDGTPRCVNLAPASLADSAFAGRLRAHLFAAPRVARKLSLEVAEVAAIERFGLLQELCRQLRPCGVRLGLEHAGVRLGQVDRLFALGLDFIKLDTTATRGVGTDAQRLRFVRGSVELLHGLSLQVYAEGVGDAADAKALWSCGVDGITGPWASAQKVLAG